MNIIFQGDSATDSGRDRSCYNDLGEGYPNYAAAMIQDCFGEDCNFEFYNFACDGNSIRDLNDSLNDDFVEIKPDIVSVMIGVDDILSSEYLSASIGRHAETYHASTRHPEQSLGRLYRRQVCAKFQPL